MFLGINIASIFDSIRSFYLSLPEADKLIIYIILILVFILVILLIILFEQRKINKKIVNKKVEVNEDTEVLNLYGNEIDESNEKTRNLKEITDKIQAVIDSRAIDLTKFEQDQEESSIISYDELMKHSGKKIETPKEDFSLPNLVRKIEVAEEIERTEPYVNPVPLKEEEPKFKSSAFISPVFGIQGDRSSIKNDEPVIKKEESSYIKESYSEEETFLNNLRNFRKNLE
jgi:hypothetical protein